MKEDRKLKLRGFPSQPVAISWARAIIFFRPGDTDCLTESVASVNSTAVEKDLILRIIRSRRYIWEKCIIIDK